MSFSRNFRTGERAQEPVSSGEDKGAGVRQLGSSSLRSTQEAYWTYEDIGAFLFVAIALNAVVRLAVRLHLLDSSQLLAPGAALETLITVFLAKLSVRTFCIFLRELSSRERTLSRSPLCSRS